MELFAVFVAWFALDILSHQAARHLAPLAIPALGAAFACSWIVLAAAFGACAAQGITPVICLMLVVSCFCRCDDALAFAKGD